MVASNLGTPVDLEGDDLKTREILLKYYSSECTTHGAYVLSVAIGVFAFLQMTKFTNDLAAINALVLKRICNNQRLSFDKNNFLGNYSF